GRNIADVDADAEITLVDETTKDQGRFDDQDMFDTGILDDEEVVVEKAVAVKEVDATQDQVSAATTTVAKDLTIDDITLAKALEAIKTSKPKIRGIVRAQRKQFKKSRDVLEQESAKKQKIDDDQEAAKLKRCLEIVLDDEDDVTIDATPLSSKSLTIIDYKIHKERKQIISKSSRQMEPESPEAVPLSPNYVPGPEEPQQAPLLLDYPYAATNSPIALSPGYIADSDLEKDLKDESEDGPTDYLADRGDDDDDDESSGDDSNDEDDKEASEEDEDEKEEEEH
nr:hypothetical protein [Tanacetum cinerariifolium]